MAVCGPLLRHRSFLQLALDRLRRRPDHHLSIRLGCLRGRHVVGNRYRGKSRDHCRYLGPGKCKPLRLWAVLETARKFRNSGTVAARSKLRNSSGSVVVFDYIAAAQEPATKLASFGVSILTLSGLIWYACSTQDVWKERSTPFQDIGSDPCPECGPRWSCRWWRNAGRRRPARWSRAPPERSEIAAITSLPCQVTS
jgi:hypothetical protein